MNFYERRIFPLLLDLVMRQEQLQEYRRKVVSSAKGQVLEIGVGSGLNFQLYDKRVEIVIGIDRSPQLLEMARRRAAAAGIRFKPVEGSATAIPLPDNAADTAVMTWTLCSIEDPLTALREVRRVLKPDGALLFVEHGLAPDLAVEQWQHWLTPLWCRVSGGCHLDRKTDELIRSAGFQITELQTQYAMGPRAFTYMYEGIARPLKNSNGQFAM